MERSKRASSEFPAGGKASVAPLRRGFGGLAVWQSAVLRPEAAAPVAERAEALPVLAEFRDHPRRARSEDCLEVVPYDFDVELGFRFQVLSYGFQVL